MEIPKRHTRFEDAQGIAYGATMAAFGITLLTNLGLITGQTAGLAVLLSYLTGWSFAVIFFAVNIPFYWLGYRRMGVAFVIKTFAAVAALSILSALIPNWIALGDVNPVFGAVLFGMVSGSALLALFRHGASLGGIGILGLYLQDRTGFRAGWTQLLFDGILFCAALLVLQVKIVALSFLGAAIVNLVIAVNHRHDRYIAT